MGRSIPDCTRVEFTFANGSQRYFAGPDAQQFVERIVRMDRLLDGIECRVDQILSRKQTP